MSLDETHDPGLSSWVESANDPRSDFPIQNLPHAVFRRAGSGEPYRGGVAIGDRILDVGACVRAGVFDGPRAAGAAGAAGRGISRAARAARATGTVRAAGPAGAAKDAAILASGASLNELMAAGSPAWIALRVVLSRLLRRGSRRRAALEGCLLPQAQAEYALPARIGDYTDFYTSIHHATAVGRLLRPDEPLLPNYKWLPVAYHGRCSSIGVSGEGVRRPVGQILERGASAPAAPNALNAPNVPVVRATGRLDYEVELGAFIGPGNPRGTRVSVADAESHVFGLCLLDDWSARDIQAFEYQPLGPFLGKSFATTLSPWVVTLAALAPYRAAWDRPAADPPPQPYLDSKRLRASGAIDITLEAYLETASMRLAGIAPCRLSRTSYRHAYWTLAQMIAHHSVGGCNLRPGDLLATGTQSGPRPAEAGSLLELSAGGREPLRLANGESRCFLEDGDRVVLRGYCARSGAARIGFGEVVGQVLTAVPLARSDRGGRR